MSGNGLGALSPQFAALPPDRKSVHLNHNRYALLDFRGGATEAAADALRTDLAFIRALRIGGGSVIHAARDASLGLGQNPETGETVVHALPAPEAVFEGLSGMAALMDCGLPLFIENTYETPAWFADLFSRIEGSALDGLAGFCLDIGHARIWGGRPLADWIGLCADLSGRGIPLHAHLHSNAGDRDSHLPLCVGDRMGLFDPSPAYAPGGLARALMQMDALCGTGIMVLESDPAHAPENLGWTRAMLAGAAEPYQARQP